MKSKFPGQSVEHRNQRHPGGVSERSRRISGDDPEPGAARKTLATNHRQIIADSQKRLQLCVRYFCRHHKFAYEKVSLTALPINFLPVFSVIIQ